MQLFPTPRSARRALLVVCLAGAALLQHHPAHAQAADPADQVCSRFAPGSALPAPPDLYSQGRVLEVTLRFQTVTDAQGLMRYCYVTSAGLQAPTLHVAPGDQLIIHLQNNLPSAGPPPMGSSSNTECSADPMGPATTNLHFHGMNLPPTCHQDDVIGVLVQPATTFDYVTQIPADEPPGLYWYHPHPHGFSEGQVLGGAAGALIVEGIESVSPAVAGLQQRLFVLRDQKRTMPPGHAAGEPLTDLSVNYVPVTYPNYVTPMLQTPAASREFWRVLNASADEIFDLQYLINGVPQPLQIVAIDGIPVGHGTGAIQTLTDTHFLLAAGARVEFIVVTPSTSDQGQLVTQAVDAGPHGMPYPARPLASITATAAPAPPLARQRLKAAVARTLRFATLAATVPDAQRKLFFSETFDDPHGHNGYFITLDGHTPKRYDMSAPPDLVLHEGAVEDWTVENRSQEDHVFHIHQLHFQILAINGTAVSDPALRDTVNVPHWSGAGPYPSVTLRMDFRDPAIVGTFVYHCHLLSHEDHGMMATLQLLPAGVATSTSLASSATSVNVNVPLTLTATVTPATLEIPLTGTVQFSMDGVPLGNPVTVANGQAAYTTSFAVSGKHAVSASYSGDADCKESQSEEVALSVEDFSLSSPPIVIPSPGQSGRATITLAATSGFNSRVDFSCSLPDSFSGAGCAVNPAALTSAGTTVLTVTTSAAHGRLGSAIGAPTLAIGLAAVTGNCAWSGLLRLSRRRHAPCATHTAAPAARRRRLARWVLWLLVPLLALGCSSNGGGGRGTPAGTYDVTVTATAAQGMPQLQHALTVAVEVH